ncbi:MAG: phosphatase PAP2-related protein [bacterium]
METYHTELFSHKHLFSSEWIRSLAEAVFLLTLSFVCQHIATVYALSYSSRPTSTYVGDLLLDNLPVVDLNFIIIEVALFAIVITVLFVVLFRPRYILFTLKALALFIAIRALFMSLTHMGIYPGHITPGSGFFDAIYSYFNMQTGFFFSGHTGMPFLMALIFWKKPLERNLFLLLSFVFAIAVLLAHIHYSIDVLAAPFMAYGIFKIARYLFLRDYKLIESEHV